MCVYGQTVTRVGRLGDIAGGVGGADLEGVRAAGESGCGESERLGTAVEGAIAGGAGLPAAAINAVLGSGDAVDGYVVARTELVGIEADGGAPGIGRSVVARWVGGVGGQRGGGGDIEDVRDGVGVGVPPAQALVFIMQLTPVLQLVFWIRR